MNRLVLAAVSTLAVVAIGIFGAWYFLLRDTSPPPVDLASAVAAVSSSTAATASTSTNAVATATTAAEAPASETQVSSLEGTWQIASGSDSFVGYRVEEELVSFGATTAVGRTTVVTGSLTYADEEITAVSIEADLSQLASDKSMRDNAIKRQALESSTYPTATFVLTSPIAIDGDIESGDAIEATATGDLTIHGVTQSVSIPLQGQLVDGKVVVVGSLEIEFADYDIDPPSAASVVSVEDHGIIELQLVFEQA